MDRINNRIAHVYGYAVCLTAVIVMFFAIKQIIDSAINLSDPLRADIGGYTPMGRSLTNFELYSLQARRQPNFPMYGPMQVAAAPRNPADTSEAELRRLYDKSVKRYQPFLSCLPSRARPAGIVDRATIEAEVERFHARRAPRGQ